jgi:hypothetical protein
MAGIEKSVLGSVRLDSDVWEAVRGMECSLNQYLRSALLGEMRLAEKSPKGTISVEKKAGKVSATVNLLSDSDPSQIPGVSRGLPVPVGTFKCNHCGLLRAPKNYPLCATCAGEGHHGNTWDCGACADQSGTGAI